MESETILKACPNPWCIARSPPLPCALKHDGWRVLCECGVASWRKPTEAEAIAAWNTRTEPSTITEEGLVEQLRKERDHWKSECKSLCEVVSQHTRDRAAITSPHAASGHTALLSQSFTAGFDACCAHYLMPTGPNNRGILEHELEKYRAALSRPLP